MKTIPFIIARKRIKYLGINLTKEVLGLYAENYKTWSKEIKGGLDEWKDVPQPWMGRLHVAETAVLPRLMGRFVVAAINILLPSFCTNQ